MRAPMCAKRAMAICLCIWLSECWASFTFAGTRSTTLLLPARKLQTKMVRTRLYAELPGDLLGVRLPKYVEISQEALLAAAVMQSKKDDLKKLLDAGAPLEAISSKGRTALACAAVVDDVESASMLLEHGAHLEALDDSGRTPLALAAAYGNFELVRFFVMAGANIEARDNGKMTALLWAAVNGNEDVVRFLLDNGADIQAKDEDGMTALKLATFGKRSGVMKLLLLVNEVTLQKNQKKLM
mmetsp:Transcript_21627/g.40734  ORF Transcript_21627/g.40734 Transcript_21627/m.40734 type:complete len:241 (-) Transcript_21627:237-959(-)